MDIQKRIIEYCSQRQAEEKNMFSIEVRREEAKEAGKNQDIKTDPWEKDGSKEIEKNDRADGATDSGGFRNGGGGYRS